MNYESMSDFEINKLVAPLLNYLVQDINDDSMIGMSSRFHEQYPNTVWVAEKDPITGEQVSAWEQKCFTRIADDAWPIIELIFNSGVTLIVNGSGVTTSSLGERCNGKSIEVNCKPLRAAMIVFLMMNE